MNVMIVLSIISAGIGLLAFAFVLRKLATGAQTLPVTVEWIDELSVERYRPMFRLLNEEDVRFLASQPGYTATMARKFRAQRCQIFRGYLRWLQADFQRISVALRVLMMQSQDDRPDLAAILLRQQVLFVFGLGCVYVRLFLYRFGLMTVEVDGVMRAFDSLRVELRQLVPVHGGAEI